MMWGMDYPRRLDTESDAQYGLFCAWLDQVDPAEAVRKGSAPAVAERLGITPAYLKRLKSTYRWVDRRSDAGWDAAAIRDWETRQPPPAEAAQEREEPPPVLSGDVEPARPPHDAQAAGGGAPLPAWTDRFARGMQTCAAAATGAARAVVNYYAKAATGEAPTDAEYKAAALALKHYLPPQVAAQFFAAALDQAGADAPASAEIARLAHLPADAAAAEAAQLAAEAARQAALVARYEARNRPA